MKHQGAADHPGDKTEFDVFSALRQEFVETVSRGTEEIVCVLSLLSQHLPFILIQNIFEILYLSYKVLLHDPLYVWTLSPLKAIYLQRKPDMDTSEVTNADVLETGNEQRGDLDDSSVNKMAERVLVRLKQKLDGIEDGTLLSIKGQVNHLIREARDPKNLCRLFPGWQPWI